jgi:LysR family glycine cleavage system transcriptional activator
MTTMVNVRDFAADEVDVSIQWGFGAWKDYEVKLLMRDPKIICCSPEVAKRIASPEDLEKMTLLHPVMARDFWSKVLTHLGVQAGENAGEIEFQDNATMRRAAISGIGVGMVSRMDALADIAQGHLVAPLGTDALAKMDAKDVPGFYLVVPKAHKRVKIIASFCEWITAEKWSAEEAGT